MSTTILDIYSVLHFSETFASFLIKFKLCGTKEWTKDPTSDERKQRRIFFKWIIESKINLCNKSMGKTQSKVSNENEKWKDFPIQSREASSRMLQYLIKFWFLFKMNSHLYLAPSKLSRKTCSDRKQFIKRPNKINVEFQHILQPIWT